jgi:hypothetical protein
VLEIAPQQAGVGAFALQVDFAAQGALDLGDDLASAAACRRAMPHGASNRLAIALQQARSASMRCRCPGAAP